MDRRALVIGIDRYANLPQPLAGCVNDARVLSGLLQTSFGFAPSGIVTLLNEEATRERILAELDALVDATGEGDLVVVTYSGHGSQMTDREGDEPDGMDETIVPHDSGRAPHEKRDISDDELYVRLLALSRATPFVTLIFDCCHSGSIVRDAFGERARWIEPDRRPTSELPPSAVPADLVATTREVGPSGWLPVGERYVLIAGCRDDESSYEHTVAQDGQAVVHGALTYFLAREIARAGPGTTYRDVFEAAGAQVTAAKPRQHPQMEGAADRELFGVREIEPVRFLGVGPRVGGVVTLRAGLVHGVSSGARWAVHPPGTKEVGATAPSGLVEVTAVRATESDAAVVEESAEGAIAEGCRAVEVRGAESVTRLRVQVVAPNASTGQLLGLIEGSGQLRRVDDGEPADARIYRIEPRGADDVGAGVPVPQLGPVREPTWAVVGSDGLLMMPSHPAGVDGSGERAVVSNLEAAARYRRALSLSDPGGVLRGKVGFELQRRTGNAWVEARPDPARGTVVYEDGDRVALEIHNRHTEPVYVSVLDFGLAGAVGLLYPVAGASEPLTPGRSISVGVREGDELELRLPDRPWAAADPGDRSPEEGTETFKLIATTSPADLRPLVQDGFRDVSRPARLRPGDAWVTIDRSFTLRRARG